MEALSLFPVQKMCHRTLAKLRDVQVDGCQRRVGIRGEKLVVASNNRHIIRHTDAHAVQLAQHTHGDQIVNRDDGGGPLARFKFR